MNLLAPLGLLGLLAILPVVALYFLKLRRQERLVPSTLLWKKVIEDLHVNAPFQKLRYSLLLILQILLLALLALALARPFLSMAATRAPNLILMIDTSASMGTRDAGPDGKRTRLEQAVLDAKAKVDEVTPKGHVRIVSFDEEVRHSPFSNDRTFLKNHLDGIRASHLRTRAQEAFETAVALAAEREEVEVVVLSDGCFGGLRLENLLGPRPAQGNVEDLAGTKLEKFHFASYGKEESDNVGLTGMNARTRLVEALDDQGNKTWASETQVFVMVENFAPVPKDVIVQLTSELQSFEPAVIKLKGRPRGEETLSGGVEEGHTVEAAREQKVWKLPLNTAGLVTVKIVSPKDAFALDDQAQVMVGQTEGYKVLHVTAGGYFVEKALKVMHEAEVTKMAPEEFQKAWTLRGAQTMKGYDAALFEGHGPPEWPEGGAVFLGVLPPLPGFKIREKAEVEWPEIIDWDLKHPVLRHIKFGGVDIRKAKNWEAPKTAEVLVEGSTGPLMVAQANDRLRVIGVAFESLESTWGFSTPLPIFLKQSLAWVAEVSPRRCFTALRTGQPLALPPVGEAVSLELVKPEGGVITVPLPADRKALVKGLDRVGVYGVRGMPEGKEYQRTFAVNLTDPQESDNWMRRILTVGTRKVEAEPAAISSRREVWSWLALAAAALLTLEWLVYHRRIGI